MKNLSKRQLTVVKLITDGYTYQEIADLMFISKETVKSHMKDILLITGAKNSPNLVRLYMEYVYKRIPQMGQTIGSIESNQRSA